MIRPALLMCAPTHYDVDYVINPWMQGNVHLASKERATAQWQRLHHVLSGLSDVKLVQPQLGVPDMVFTANAGLAFGRSVALSHFHFSERQGEEPHFERWFETEGYDVFRMPEGVAFEGEGDALFSADASRLWAGHGFRTDLASHDELRRRWSLEVISLRLVDPRFYHLDTCFAPLPGGALMYFPPAFDVESQRIIRSFYTPDQCIEVPAEDAERFACNVVCLDKTLVLNRISDTLHRELQSRGFEVVQLELDEFLKAGGAAKCLVMHIG